MNLLPRYDNVVIPVEKFTKYALNPNKQPDKALAFELALGYNHENAGKLIENIRLNVGKFPSVFKGNKGYGELYEVIIRMTGENGKTANVLTGWIDDKIKGETRLTSVYIYKRKERA